MGSSPPVEGEPTLGFRRKGVLALRTLLLQPKEFLTPRKLLQHLPLPLSEGAGDADLPQYLVTNEDDWAGSSQTCCCPPPASPWHPEGGTAPPPYPPSPPHPPSSAMATVPEETEVAERSRSEGV